MNLSMAPSTLLSSQFSVSVSSGLGPGYLSVSPKAICSHIWDLSFLKLLHTLVSLVVMPHAFSQGLPQNGKTLFMASCSACQILQFAYVPLPNKGVFLSVSPNAGVQSFRENYHNQPWKIASQVQGLKNIIFFMKTIKNPQYLYFTPPHTHPVLWRSSLSASHNLTTSQPHKWHQSLCGWQFFF